MKNAFLAIGAIVIAAVATYTLTHLTDRVIATVLVPGVVVGLVFLVLGSRAGKNNTGSGP